MIYAIGDSHAGLFNGSVEGTTYVQPQYGHDYKIDEGKFIKLHQNSQNDFLVKDKNFISIRTGANTAYNMLTRVDLVDDIVKQYKIKNTDYILFCYGEIDTREHIGKQQEAGRDLQEIIANLADRYIEFVNRYKDMGYNVIVWGVIPAGRSTVRAHRLYWTAGERNRLSELINNEFYNRCKKSNIDFVSIWPDLMDSLDPHSYFADDIHLNYDRCKDFMYNRLSQYMEK